MPLKAATSCGVEGPPPIAEFDRYAKSIIPKEKMVPRFATRISLGELIAADERPPRRVSVPRGHVKELTVATPTNNSLTDMLTAVAAIKATPSASCAMMMMRRPLTCLGLPVREYALTTTPKMGIRTLNRSLNMTQKSGVVTQPPWTSPCKSFDFEHHRPFQSSMHGQRPQAFIVHHVLPDSKGNFTENARYSHFHARQVMDRLQRDSSRPTDWSHSNLRARTRPFRNVSLTPREPPSKSLYNPPAALLSPQDTTEIDGMKAEFEKIKSERRRYAKASCGKDKKSLQQAQANRAKFAKEQRARQRDVVSHISQHDQKSLSYITAFSAADTDGSGAINSSELEAVLRHLGLQFSNESAQTLLERYDTDFNGALSLPEFMRFARDAMGDANSTSIFLRKKQLMKMTKTTMTTTASLLTTTDLPSA